MLNILGVGFAHPKTEISTDMLDALNKKVIPVDVSARFGISKRYSVLKPSYLNETGNSDAWVAKINSEFSATDISFEAANKALAGAKISAEQIGLVIGETSTPVYTIPTEAQRLGARLGIKVPAYDIITSNASLALFFENLLSWQDKKIPDYALYISSNMLTERVNYNEGDEGFLFSDMASACVVSTRRYGRMKVIASFYESYQSPFNFSAEIYGHLKVSPNLDNSVLAAEYGNLYDKARADLQFNTAKTKIICPQITVPAIMEFTKAKEIASSNNLMNVAEYGSNPVSSPLSVLAESNDKLQTGDLVLILMTGLGLSRGFTFLEIH